MSVAARSTRLATVSGVDVMLSDSVTVFGGQVAGSVLVTGSHGGASALIYAIRAGVRAVVVNDAGVGKDSAGISGLVTADGAGIGAVAVGNQTARIGDGRDTWERGRVTHLNGLAEAAGVRPGMDVPAAVERLVGLDAPPVPDWLPAAVSVPVEADPGPPRVLLIDSAAAVGHGAEGAVVVTGSHGGAAHGRALDVEVLAAVFNDAGVGKDDAGVGRLALLDRSSVIGLTVSHLSARIGEAADTWVSGVVSAVNEVGLRHGLRVGETVQASVRRIQSRARRSNDREVTR